MIDKSLLQIALGNRIRQIREIKNISQQDLAAACNFEKANLSRLEAGRTNPTLVTLYKLAENLDVTLSTLMDFKLKK